MLTQVHFLLTYTCNFECDHCFLYCGPRRTGTFSVAQIKDALDQIVRTETVEWVYFEGGEPFLYYPLMTEGIKLARQVGLKTGLVTNGYWATTEEDAEVWLKPLRELQVADISVSDDGLHYGDNGPSPAKHALAAARKLNIPASSICVEKPTVKRPVFSVGGRGEPVVGGTTVFRGRAVEKLAEDLPTRPWQKLTECPYERLEAPGRVHIDPFGNVHICQGLTMGNIWKTPLPELVRAYNVDSHPISGPLYRGGPALLAKEHGVEREEAYVDECHFCYSLRRNLLDRFPDCLTPRQVYGL